LAAGGEELEQLSKRARIGNLSREQGGGLAPRMPSAPLALLGPESGAIIPYEPPPAVADEDPAGVQTEGAIQVYELRARIKTEARADRAQLHSDLEATSVWMAATRPTHIARGLVPGAVDTAAAPAAGLFWPSPTANWGSVVIDNVRCTVGTDKMLTALQKHLVRKERGFAKDDTQDDMLEYATGYWAHLHKMASMKNVAQLGEVPQRVVSQCYLAGYYVTSFVVLVDGVGWIATSYTTKLRCST
jgi:hypothetical protein